MRKSYKLYVATLLLALVAGTADAKGKPGSGGGTTTNFGCKTFAAGTTLQSPTGAKQLTAATWSCYLCNMSSHVCTIQSPSTLVGWWFLY